MVWYGNGPPTLSGFLDLCQDIDKIEDSVKKQSTIAFIHNFGQMPRQVCTCVCVVCACSWLCGSTMVYDYVSVQCAIQIMLPCHVIVMRLLYSTCDAHVIMCVCDIQLFKKPHRQRKVVFLPTVTSGTSMTPDGTTTSGLEGRRLSPFNKNLFQLMPTRDPILSESYE